MGSQPMRQYWYIWRRSSRGRPRKGKGRGSGDNSTKDDGILASIKSTEAKELETKRVS